MSVREHGRRPASALGVGTINLLAPAPSTSSGWKSSRARGTSGTANGIGNGERIQPRDSGEYDVDELDFDAYQRRRFPNATAAGMNGGADVERSASSLGLSSTENLAAGYTRRDHASSLGGPAAPQQGRLKSMLRSINTRPSAVPATHRTPGVPGGRTSSMSTKGDGTPSPQTTTIAKATPPSALSIDSTSTTTTAKPRSTPDTSQPPTSSSPPPSPGPDSDAESSSSLDEIDEKAFRNGMAARKHYRALQSRLGAEVDAWRKDPRNTALSDYELNEGAKRVEFEDPELRGLYRELSNYVNRGAALGEYWDRAKGSVGLEGLESDEEPGLEGDYDTEGEQNEDDGVLVDRIAEAGDSDIDAVGRYHDALDEPAGDTVDLASVDEGRYERPRTTRVHSINTDLPQTMGPSSTTSSSSRQMLYNSSPDSTWLSLPPQTRPTLSHHASGSTSTIPSYLTQQTAPTYPSNPNSRPALNEQASDSSSEEDIPISKGGKFENLALNDTLQLRHQQLAQSQVQPLVPPSRPKSQPQVNEVREMPTLPPDAIIYEPPRPKSVKRPKRVSPPVQAPYPTTSLGQAPYSSTSLTHGGVHSSLGGVAVKASLTASAMQREGSFLAQREREAQIQREREAQVQREREAQMQREREAELAAQREVAQVQAQREAQLQSQRENQRKMAPAGKARRPPASTVQAQQAAQAAQVQNQMQNQQAKLNRSAGKRRDDGGASGAEERRPRSRGREEEEYALAPAGSRAYHHASQSHPPRQQYGEQWQDPYVNGHGHYQQPYPSMDSPDPHQANGVGVNPNGRGGSNGALVRSNTVPTRGSADSGMGSGSGLGISGTSEEVGMPPAVGRDRQVKRDGAGRVIVTINRNEYEMHEMIGKGGSSKVYRVVSRKDHKQYALKKVAINMVDDDAMRSYATEIQMLKRLSGNDCIVRLVDDELRGKNQATLFLVMELGETDFAKLLVERQGTPIRLTWIAENFRQMLDAVNVIHEERIVHSDLKPANFVLIKGTLKLIDFGIAKAIANDTTNIQRDAQIGTLNYMSPETMNAAPGDDRLKIGRPSDVWSLGCILYQMVYGSAPFAALNFQQKMIAIAREEHVIQFPEYAVPVVPKEKSSTGKAERLEDRKVRVPKVFLDTMKACLQREAKKRPTILMMLEEPWLNDPYSALEQPVAQSVAPPNVQRLASDEAIISNEHMRQMINYCFRESVSGWDDEDPANIQQVGQLVNTILPQLKALRPSDEYVP